MLRLKKFHTVFVAVYNLIVLLLALVVYRSLDFNKHFDFPKNTPDTLSTVAYFTISIHSTSGGTVTPKTPLARRLVSLHLLLVMVPLILVFA